MTIQATTLYEEKSFWLRDYGAYEPNPSIEGDLAVDVAVVGGGFTGLSTAREFKTDDPGASVAVLEGDVVGYGASGRNAGFSMKLFGLEPGLTQWRWGRERTIASQRFMQQAVAYVKTLIEKHDLHSDYRHTGMFRVSYSPRQLDRLEKTFDLFNDLGVADDMSFATKEELQDEFHTDRFLGGLHEREVGILNPCKHVRELKRLAEALGVTVYERTPVRSAAPKTGGVTLETPGGRVTAQKVVFATNAYSRTIAGLPKLRSRQVPVWTFIVITEPLTDAQWADIGWLNRQSFEDNRQLVHYFRPTVDGRILMGGGDVTIPYGDSFDHDFAPKIWQHCEQHLKWIFPQLEGVKIAYRWGGPVSCPLELTPEVGFIGDERIVYSLGYVGHGVSMSQYNGRLVADLLGGRDTELSRFWIVNRKAIPWPATPLAWPIMRTLRRAFRWWDALEERPLRK
jgi:glycine/D-amino acid oxidase-like deaminating enzyme